MPHKTIIFYSAMEPERTPPTNRANLPADESSEPEVLVLEGVGHMPNLEQPEAFNAGLEAFLRSS